MVISPFSGRWSFDRKTFFHRKTVLGYKKGVISYLNARKRNLLFPEKGDYFPLTLPQVGFLLSSQKWWGAYCPPPRNALRALKMANLEKMFILYYRIGVWVTFKSKSKKIYPTTAFWWRFTFFLRVNLVCMEKRSFFTKVPEKWPHELRFSVNLPNCLLLSS